MSYTEPRVIHTKPGSPSIQKLMFQTDKTGQGQGISMILHMEKKYHYFIDEELRHRLAEGHRNPMGRSCTGERSEFWSTSFRVKSFSSLLSVVKAAEVQDQE